MLKMLPPSHYLPLHVCSETSLCHERLDREQTRPWMRRRWDCNGIEGNGVRSRTHCVVGAGGKGHEDCGLLGLSLEIIPGRTPTGSTLSESESTDSSIDTVRRGTVEGCPRCRGYSSSAGCGELLLGVHEADGLVSLSFTGRNPQH